MAMQATKDTDKFNFVVLVRHVTVLKKIEIPLQREWYWILSRLPTVLQTVKNDNDLYILIQYTAIPETYA